MKSNASVAIVGLAATVLCSSASAGADTGAAEIGYSAKVVDNSVVLTTTGGSLTSDGSDFQLRGEDGELVASLPLSYHLDGKRWPISATIAGNNAVLIPDRDPSHAVADPAGAEQLSHIALDPQSPEFNGAMGAFSTQVNLAITMGALLGTAVGGGIGCLVGGVVGAAAGVVATIGVLAIPGFLGGCLATGLIGITLGAAIGSVALGVPAAIVSGLLFVDALNRPPTK
ncbi:hypothetical protein AB0M22_22750 [Nocardia sp. NPDC051756]|uniref:hypothetical protein n=1 Tax=Nocardia sp. NPDC051756 TaxID=3154751 RepID=UPI003434EF53